MLNATNSKLWFEIKLWFEVKYDFVDQGRGLNTPTSREIFVEYANNNETWK